MNVKEFNLYSINKPKGPSSYSIISQIKKITGEQKVGHAGTLDPLASGVLVVGIGREATKKLAEIVIGEKEYIADIKLGVSSTTDDEEGIKHKSHNSKPIILDEVKNIINNFIGKIEQAPPAYSAVKVGGQRSYKLARIGKSKTLKSRSIVIKSIKVLKYQFPNLKIKVVCGSGVYIRSLARDIGASLGTLAYMSNLERIRVGQFKINSTTPIKKIAKEYLNQEINILKNGGLGVIPTDTIYGLVGQALKPKTVERIYKVRKRSPDKPFIVLINSLSDLKKFGVKINTQTKKILQKYWPGQISIILPCDKKLAYLHRGTNSLAFRLPNNNWLRQILKKTGPLVAPSANVEGQPPAPTIKKAKMYFTNEVDFYFNCGKLESPPSTLIKIENNKIIVLREGIIKI